MQINTKQIGAAFVVLALLQGSLWFYFDTKIKSEEAELVQNSTMIHELSTLSDKWSKKSQKEEYEKLLSLLGAFGVKYSVKEVRDKRVISMELEIVNANKVVSLLVNRNIEILKLKMQRVDEYIITLEVEIA